jgi:hypothetical protein
MLSRDEVAQPWRSNGLLTHPLNAIFGVRREGSCGVSL